MLAADGGVDYRLGCLLHPASRTLRRHTRDGGLRRHTGDGGAVDG